MTVYGIAMVKDEADVIGETIRHMLTQVDEIIVMDNGSTDGTRDILAGFPVRIIDDPEVAYWQAARMSKLARMAGDMTADWVVPFDADEIWFSIHGRLGDVLDRLPFTTWVAHAQLFDHVATIKDTEDGPPQRTIEWHRTDQVPLPKVAFRPYPGAVLEMGNHGVAFHGRGDPVVTAKGLMEIRHFPYRSAEQFVRKARNGAAAYAAAGRAYPESTGAHWRGYGRILDEGGPEALEGVFRQWFWSKDPTADGLVCDPAPLG